jgi:hypothetical protein
MNLLGNILLACLVIAALQGILAVLAVAVVLLILWGLITRPAETIPLLLLFALLQALELWPVATLTVIGCLGGAVLIASRRRFGRTGGQGQPPLLPPPTRRDGG